MAPKKKLMALSANVPLPAWARPVRCQLCGVQWVLERRADGVHCVASDGAVLWEGMLGLPENDAELTLEVMPPRYPIELELESHIVLAPGGEVRGWIAVPLETRLLWSGAGAVDELVRLEPPGLRVGWRDGEGYHHPLVARLSKAPRAERGERCLWLRAYFSNRGPETVRPQRCRLSLASIRLRRMRGVVVGPRVTWVFGIRGGVRVTELPGWKRPQILQPDFRRLGETAS